jgi:hypothetical protein
MMSLGQDELDELAVLTIGEDVSKFIDPRRLKLDLPFDAELTLRPDPVSESVAVELRLFSRRDVHVRHVPTREVLCFGVGVLFREAVSLVESEVLKAVRGGILIDGVPLDQLRHWS